MISRIFLSCVISIFLIGAALAQATVIDTSSGAITNPTSVLTRSSSAVSSAVTATNATPCVFTWTAHGLQNGMAVILGGTAVPTGFVAGTVYYLVAKATNTFQLAATFGGAAIASTSTGTSVTATLVYPANSLVASDPVTPVVPSFAIANSAGGVIVPRIRVLTNATGTLTTGSYASSGWDAVVLSVNLWTAAPTYTNADGQPYAPLTGGTVWLGNYLVSLTQFGDAAAGSGPLTGSPQMMEKLASGTAIYWDIQVQTQVKPIASQTFTIVPELLN